MFNLKIKRLLKDRGIIVFLGLISVLALRLGFFGEQTFSRMSFESKTRSESIRILEEAQTEIQRSKAVGKLGILLTFPDDSWMAIRYRDTHHGGLYSLAVVRDSGEAWFQSSHHFCGTFSMYPQLIERQALGQSNQEMSEGLQGIHRLATSTDLQTARKNLMAMGFEELKR